MNPDPDLEPRHLKPGAPHRGRSDARTAVGLLAVVTLVAALSVTLPLGSFLASVHPTPPGDRGIAGGTPPGGTPPGVGAPGNASFPAGSNCNPSTPTPSALLIPIPEPSGSVPAGGTLGATVEVSVTNTSASSVTLHVPSLTVSFPLSAGGRSQLFVTAATLTLTGTGWGHARTTNVSTTLSGGTSFSSGGSATLSTQKIAVMGSAPYGSLTVEFRWHWSASSSNGTLTAGPWSTPTSTSQWPTSLASTFYPAPFVSLLGSTGPAVKIGATMTSTLGGAVPSSYFFEELENASTGKVFQDQGQTAPRGVSQYNVTIPMINYDHYLDPGTYLLHIHDGCGALLYSLSKSATFAASATVTIVVQPGTCGPITINGTGHASGSSFSIPPRSAAYTFSVPTCSGHTFQSWSGSGGIHVVTGGSMRISADGSFTVRYS